MATLTLTDRFQVSDRLPGIVRTALGLADPNAVYFGRRERGVRQGFEVCLEEVLADFIGEGGPSQTHEHQHRARIFFRSTTDAGRKGVDQQATVGKAARAFIRLFNGRRPLFSSLPDVQGHRAELVTPDATPENTGAQEAVVLLRTITTGDGTEET